MPKRKRTPPKLKDQPRLAIAKRLAAHARALGGFQPLARAITDAYCKNVSDPTWLSPGEFVIPRQKLSKLAEHDRSVSLSIVELEALDAHFNHDLTRRALFEFPSLVQELAQNSDAIIIVPSRFSSEGPMMNYWDHHGVAEIHRAVNLHATAIKLNLIDVQRGREKPGTGHGQWKHLFGKDGPPVVICIGSPRSSRATEKAFERMFNRRRKTRGSWNQLPFSFVFLNTEADSVASKFSRPLEELTGAHKQLADDVRAGKGWGLIAGARSFLSQAAVRRKAGSETGELEKKIHSYGLIAAQRQEEQLVVVVAGLTGPGSLVAAAGLSAMAENLPQAGDPLQNAVLWGVVEATVNTMPMRDGGTPLVEKLDFVIQPSLWDPKRRRPVSREATDDSRPTTPPPRWASMGGQE